MLGLGRNRWWSVVLPFIAGVAMGAPDSGNALAIEDAEVTTLARSASEEKTCVPRPCVPRSRVGLVSDTAAGGVTPSTDAAESGDDTPGVFFRISDDLEPAADANGPSPVRFTPATFLQDPPPLAPVTELQPDTPLPVGAAELSVCGQRTGSR
jgi:hypothetical protein